MNSFKNQQVLDLFKDEISEIYSDVTKFLNIKEGTFDGIRKLFSIESNDNYKHLSWLVTSNIIKFIKEKYVGLSDNFSIDVSIITMCDFYEEYVNEFLIKSDDNLIKDYIEPLMDQELSKMTEHELIINKNLIDNYKSNYILAWYNYQDFIGKLIREIFNKYMLICSYDDLMKANFINILLLYVYKRLIDYTDIKNDLFENAVILFPKIDEIMNYVQSKNNSSYEFIIAFISSIFNMIQMKCQTFKEYNICVNVIRSFKETHEFIKILDSLSSNINYNNKYLQTIKEDNFIVNEFQINNDILFENRERVINIGSFNILPKEEILEIVGIIKSESLCLKQYRNYNHRNLRKILSYVDGVKIKITTNVLSFLTDKISITGSIMEKIEHYIKLFKVPRAKSTPLIKDLTEGEIERLKIIKAILEDKPVMIFNNCMNNINEDTRQIIINNLRSLNEKTIIVSL